ASGRTHAVGSPFVRGRNAAPGSYALATGLHPRCRCLFLWAEREGRVLVTMDLSTMPPPLAAHLQSGHHSSGVVTLRPGHTLSQLVSIVVVGAYLLDPAELQDQFRFLP